MRDEVIDVCLGQISEFLVMMFAQFFCGLSRITTSARISAMIASLKGIRNI